MKAKLIVGFLLLSFKIYSQDYSSADLFSRDINGKIYFNEVIQVDSITKDLLYYNAKVFFAEVFKSANDVIQMDDKENGVLIGKGFTNVYAKAVFRDGLIIYLDFTGTVQMWYTIKIQCKDNRYKYDIYDIYFINIS